MNPTTFTVASKTEVGPASDNNPLQDGMLSFVAASLHKSWPHPTATSQVEHLLLGCCVTALPGLRDSGV